MRNLESDAAYLVQATMASSVLESLIQVFGDGYEAHKRQDADAEKGYAKQVDSMIKSLPAGMGEAVLIVAVAQIYLMRQRDEDVV